MLGRPELTLRWPQALAVALVPTFAYIVIAFSVNDRLTDPFVHGRGEWSSDRGDGVYYVYTRLDTADPEFADAATAFVARHRPETDVNIDDLAVFFTDSTAKSMGKEPLLKTLCLYEDGTPDRWLDGKGDCFSEHISLTERMHELANRFEAIMPHDVATFAMFRELCTGVTVPEHYDDGSTEHRTCHRVDLQGKRSALEQKYTPEDLARYLDG